MYLSYFVNHKAVLFIVLLCLPVLVLAQIDSSFNLYSNQRNKIILIQKDTILLDSFSVFPEVELWGKKEGFLAASSYQIADNKIIFKSLPKDSFLRVKYRVLPYVLGAKKQHKDKNNIGKSVQYDGLIGSGYTYNPFTNKASDAFQFNDLDYSGVFARGLSMGNKQDLILNSNLNLQVAGKLGDIEILGAISDNNIPLQPEGNTQQLQDFDRIFIQFQYKKQKFIAGDFDLKSPKGSYFVNYFRRLQGGQLQTDLKLGKKQRLQTDGSFAVSKGKFARNRIQGEEGNQGPYKLQGSSGERFVIIVAGTERVFLDGKLLTRGADRDYIIDYNLGEITFTSNLLITKDKRIQIEFSYTDLTYLRTVATANTRLKRKNVEIYFNFYSEQDAKGQTVSESLSDSSKAVLTRIGDDLSRAYISGVSLVDPSQDRVGTVFYKMIDTLLGTFYFDSILVYTTNPDSARYAAKFTAVEGGGDYIRTKNAANGVVYRWVGRDTLTQKYKGTHQAIRLLTTPKEQQLYNIGTKVNIGKNTWVAVDFAWSNKDQNTFSEVGNNDNQGVAARLTYFQKIPLYFHTKKDSNISQNTIGIKAHYEYLQAQFAFVEPYRTREFARDWNINNSQPVGEQWYKAAVYWEGKKWGRIAYEFSGLNRDSLYNGLQNKLTAAVNWQGLEFKTTSSLLQNQTTKEKALFFRPKADISYTFRKLSRLKIGVNFEQEYNQQSDLVTDSLSPASFFYQVFKAYVNLPTSKKIKLQAFYARRYDYSPKQTQFENTTIADDMNIGGHWKPVAASKLEWNFNYRNLRVQDSALTATEAKETYLGRLEYILNIKKGFVRSNTIYQLGAGQQQKIQYNYVKVDKGQGTHIWIDRNADEVQQTNEFEKANFQDQAEYIRVSLLTGEFIKTNNVSFSQSLIINPKRLIKIKKTDKTPLGLDFLQRLSTRSLFKIDRKTFAAAKQVVAINPFQIQVSDTALVAISSSIRNYLYFNRSGTYSLEFSQSDSRSKTLLVAGFDSRSLAEYMFRQKLNFRRKKIKGQKIKPFFRNVKLQALLELSLGNQGNRSEFYPARDYLIDFYKIKPQFTFLYQRFLRVILRYKYLYKKNKIGQEEELKSHDITAEVTYNQLSKTNIKASFSYVQLQYDGDTKAAVGYTMTAGLQRGNNFLWNLSVNQALSKNIQMIVSYEGRSTGTAAVVHVGRVQIRATF